MSGVSISQALDTGWILRLVSGARLEKDEPYATIPYAGNVVHYPRICFLPVFVSSSTFTCPVFYPFCEVFPVILLDSNDYGLWFLVYVRHRCLRCTRHIRLRKPALVGKALKPSLTNLMYAGL